MGPVNFILDLLPRGSFPAVVSRAANAGLAFLSTVIIVRALSVDDYGVYSLAVTTLGLIALAGQLGFDILTPRSLGVYVHDKDWPHAFSFIRWTTMVVLGASVLAYAGATVVLTWNPMHWDAVEVLTTRIILLGLPFVAMLRVERSRLQAFDKTALGIFFELPFWNTMLLLSGILLFAVPSLRTSGKMAALHAFTFGIAFLGAHLALRRNLPARPAQLEPVPKAWMRHGILFTVLAALGFIVSSGDVLIAGTFLSSSDTGHYSVAVRSAGLTLVVLQPLQQVVAPRIAKAWSRGDEKEATRLARRCGQLSLIAGIPMALFFWFAGPVFLKLFGGAYGDALWALRWLSLAQVLSVLAGPGSLVMQMIHEEVASIWILGATTLVGLPLTVFMAKEYGIQGLGLAKVLTLSAVSVASYVVLRRKKGIDIWPWRRVARPAPS